MFRTIPLPSPRAYRMKLRPAPVALLAALALSGCGGFGSDSGLNPFRWLGGARSAAPATLAPKHGYTNIDNRQPIAHLLSARWEPLDEGRLLVVTALAPTAGWWDVGLVTETLQPAGRLRADPDGVLRLRLVGNPPPPDSTQARMVAQPGRDTLTVALTISGATLDGLSQVVVSGAGNAVTLGR